MKARAQIFLSYTRLDKEKVENLYQQLSDAGFKPWMDKKDILPGERWKSSIRKAIRRSDFFLACLSAKSVNKRGFIQREIKDALDIWEEKLEDDIYLIPVRLEDCDVPESLRDFQWVNLFEENEWTRLVEAIQVGMDRRAEGTKPIVQEPTPFKLYPAHEKPSLGTEMATPEEGPEQVQMLEYEDFEVKIGREQGKEYPVSVITSPAGETNGTFVLPFSSGQLKEIKGIIRTALQRSLRPMPGLPSPTKPAEMVKEFGGELYEALFRDEVETCLDRSFALVYAKGKGLRIRLRLHPSLANLPWEFMYRPRDGDFLAFLRTSLVRYIEHTESISALFVSPLLRILIVSASPSDCRPLDVEGEQWRIYLALKELLRKGTIELEFLEGRDSFSNLQQTLRQGNFHVLHFIGHGDYDEETQEGILTMEDARGRSKHISGQQLGRLLRQHPSIRVVVLNACKGALTSSSDPFTGVAAAVVRASNSAVVAMQFEISDPAAKIFSKEFYGALADRYPVDAAVTEARLAIVQSREHSIEWATPVLFMRAPEGTLFDSKN